MNKKIVFISYRLGYSNLLYWDSILISLKAKYKHLRVFTAFPSLKTSDASLETEHRLKGIKIYLNKGKVNAFLFYLPLPFFVLRLYKYKPNLVIINEFNLNSLYIIFFKSLINNPKILLLVESDPFLGYEKKHSFFRTYIRKFIVNNADKILTNNLLGKDYLVKTLNSKIQKIFSAPYLVSIPPEYNKKLNSSKKVKFIYVGRIIQLKGLSYVLDAMSKLSNDQKNKIEFNIIGEGEDLELLKRVVDTNNLFFVNFHGYIDYQKLFKFYNDADCLIFNSLGDYRALVGFEALHFGCAIIGSKFDGARFEVIHENKNGFIINPYDTNEIKQKISFLINDNNSLKMFKKYSKKLSHNFSKEQIEYNFLSAIKSLEK